MVRHKNSVLCMVIAIFIALSMLIFSSEVNAATVRTIPSNSLMVSDSNLLKMTKSNYSATWNGVAGKAIVSGSAIHLSVPIKSKTSAFSYSNFLDITFTNIGQINGRQIYRAQKIFDITTTIYWHDTGETVELPFFQEVSDIDAGASYFKEAWEAVSGYSGIFYKYSPCTLVFSGNKVSTPSAMDHSGNNSLLKGGIYAPTTSGTFRCKFTDGNCMTGYQLFSAYEIMNDPVKKTSQSDMLEAGDKLTYDVTHKFGKFYVDTMTTFGEYRIEDVLPQGVTYKSAKVLSGSTDITSKGTLSYDQASRTVSFDMGSTWLSDADNYTGQDITMQIETQVNTPVKPIETINNTGSVVIDGITLASNEVKNEVGIPFDVEYEYVSGSNRKLPDYINTASGEYAVLDDNTYYAGDIVNRKESPAEETKHEVYDADDNYKGVWTLSWNKTSETVTDHDVVFTGTWVYTPAPRINIAKTITEDDDNFTLSHGEPSFLFKITGEDSGKVWYKSIRFSNAALEAVRTDSKYTDDTGTQFAVRDGKIYAMAETIYLPEDNYTVEEVKTSRFGVMKSEARYHGDKTKEKERKA